MALKDVLNNDSKSTKAKLDSLKAQLLSSTVDFDPKNHIANTDDFPSSQNIKVVDYNQKKIEYKEKATKVLTNIIINYIKDKNLLLSPRLADLKEQHIEKLAEWYLLVNIAESNVIMIQESIDGGDMGKDQLSAVNSAQKEMRDNINGRDKHIEKCEDYWENYSNVYGLENQEEKMILETGEKIDDNKKTIITNQTEINNMIQDRLNQIKKERDK